MARRHHDDQRLTQRIAQECARIIVEERVKSFYAAKRKAAARLTIKDKCSLPDNATIEQALQDYQRLFYATRQASHLRRLRETALEAMHFFERFRPKLVGSVLSGTATRHDDINLHLFANTPTDVLMFLMEHQIPFEPLERRFTLNNGTFIRLPVFRFDADDICIELAVFEPLAEREAPRSPIDGNPMQRANLEHVKTLITDCANDTIQ